MLHSLIDEFPKILHFPLEDWLYILIMEFRYVFLLSMHGTNKDFFLVVLVVATQGKASATWIQFVLNASCRLFALIRYVYGRVGRGGQDRKLHCSITTTPASNRLR